MSNARKLSLLNILEIFTKWRKLFFINLLIVATVSVFLSLFMPKWYKASALVLPPYEKSIGGGFASLLNSLPIGSLGIGGSSGSEMMYLAILKSESLQRDVIKRFDLQKFYETETMFETLIAFAGDYDVRLTEENMLLITYEYKDSIKVAEIVNYIVDQLGILSTKLSIEKAKIAKEFIEKRYLQNLADIDSLSNEMNKFQKRYGIIELEEQTKAIINAVSEIETDIYIKKAELEVVEKSFGKSSPQYQFEKLKLESSQQQFNKLKKGIKETETAAFNSLFLPVNQLPDLAQIYTKLYSEILLQSKLQEFLLPEYEQAKLQLMKNKPTLQIIDRAIPPDKKSKPKRALIVVGSLFVSFLITLLLVLFIEHLKWMEKNQPEEFLKFSKIKKTWSRPFRSTN